MVKTNKTVEYLKFELLSTCFASIRDTYPQHENSSSVPIFVDHNYYHKFKATSLLVLRQSQIKITHFGYSNQDNFIYNELK